MGRVKLGDIARECRLTYTGNKSGIPIIGLEHLTPGDIVLHSWDIDTDNTFNKYFKKGQVLLGRRRVYLKKAAVAPFDGICSGDITVIEAIPERLQPELLPFIIQNDRFFEFAIVGSAGSLSPRVKWEYLKDYEIELPDLHKQSELVELLKSANELKHAYQEMLTATDEMVKSQFIARFGTTEQSAYPVKTLREIALSSGEYGANTPATKYNPEKGRYIRITDIDEFGNLNDDRVSPEVADNKYLLHKGDLLFARTGATVGKTYLHKTGKALYAGYLIKYQFIDTVLPEFVFAYTHSKEYYQWVELTQKVGAQPNISAKQYDGLRIVVPPFEEQKSFVELMNQADKSKFELKQAIEKIDKAMQALMQ